MAGRRQFVHYPDAKTVAQIDAPLYAHITLEDLYDVELVRERSSGKYLIFRGGDLAVDLGYTTEKEAKRSFFGECQTYVGDVDA